MILAVEEIASQNSKQESKEINLAQFDEESVNMVNVIMKTSDLVIKSSNLNIVHGPIIEDRKSVFQGHVCTVCSKDDVR